jgi:iron complex transport system substrate-binding protein
MPHFFSRSYDELQQLHLPVLVLNWATAEDVLRLYDIIGKKLGREEQAKEAENRLQKKLDQLKNRKADPKPLSVLFIVDHTPGTLQQLYGVGSNNFVDELIQWTGGVNILEDSKLEYPVVSKEQMVRRDPDVIITVLPPQAKDEDEKTEQKVWAQMSSMKAVRERHVYCFQGDDLMIPGPTMLRLAQLLSEAFQKARITIH